MEQHTDKKMILFVCTGNTCRSPMAEALFNKINLSPDWHAESAGLAAFAGEPASMQSITVMQMDYDLDISNHRARPLTNELLSGASLVLTMTSQQRDSLQRAFPEYRQKIATIGDMADEPARSIPDPYGQNIQIYQETAAALAEMIEKIVSKLKQNN